MKWKIASVCIGLGLSGTQVLAAPGAPALDSRPASSLVEKARSDCRWVDNKWTYQRGDKRLVCRPDRPSGRGWIWNRDGVRFGWYHPGRQAWHHNAW